MPINPQSNDFYKKRTIEKDHPIRGEYFRDQTAIIHSMSFRRLKHKTQVFFAPENDHICTRIEHVMHVASIASTIAKGLNTAKPDDWNLDVELAHTIGLGHDLGHAPFGHAGEEALSQKLPVKNPFIHEINSLRIVDKLDREGSGLNLTYAVRDGIVCHNGEKFEQFLEPSDLKRDPSEIIDRTCCPTTYEGCIVRFSDKIAYLGRDIEDAIVANFINTDDIPKEIRDALGDSNGEIIDTLVKDVIESSLESNKISFSDEKFKLINELKNFNYNYIYKHPNIMKYKRYGIKIIHTLFDYLNNLYCELGQNYNKYEHGNSVQVDINFGKYLKKMESFYNKESLVPQKIVTDYISGMTDTYALRCMQQISLPEPLKFNQ